MTIFIALLKRPSSKGDVAKNYRFYTGIVSSFGEGKQRAKVRWPGYIFIGATRITFGDIFIAVLNKIKHELTPSHE